ncbi:MAG TPA: hypothetical protein VLH61_00100 [Bacteroidales bacterium]|nr:hypothetical protein [Bacteroidales bacterium]
MIYQAVYINNSLLTEGQTYAFEVLNKMELAPDDGYFVLRDPLGFKMLLTAAYYIHYGFEAGQKILCRVDKVNCNGRVFIEPQNPWYTEGQTYDFIVAGRGIRISITGETESYFMVIDVKGLIWRVKIPPFLPGHTIPDKLPCLVRRIKKAVLHLSINGYDEGKFELTEGKTYQVVFVGERTSPDDGQVYYILADEWGNKHLIKKKHYFQYGLKKDSVIRCLAFCNNHSGEMFLEPEHPVYQPGGEYIFPVNRFEEYIFSDGTKQKWVALKDHFHEDVKVRVDDDLAPHWVQFRKLKCRVNSIRKSRLEVTLVCGVE